MSAHAGGGGHESHKGGHDHPGFLGETGKILEVIDVQNVLEGHHGAVEVMEESGAGFEGGMGVITAPAAPFIEILSGEGSVSGGGGHSGGHSGGRGGGH